MTADLKALAEAATPGPWTLSNGTIVLDGGGNVIALTVHEWTSSRDYDARGRDAAFIAAATPDAILSLYRERDEAVARLDERRKKNWARFCRQRTRAEAAEAAPAVAREENERLRAAAFTVIERELVACLEADGIECEQVGHAWTADVSTRRDLDITGLAVAIAQALRADEGKAVEWAVKAERERCARIADHGMLVPPDGGSPTQGECDVAMRIAAAIRADRSEG